MNASSFGITALCLMIGWVASTSAIAAPLPNLPLSAALPPQAVPEACIQNRAETLPNPFVDVPSHHWAFKAVLTLHYCGAYRQATPPNLVEQSTRQSSSRVLDQPAPSSLIPSRKTR